ncbi:MAG: hypothetical protein IPK12_21580 [Gemmatimonadetes bacterium]|nr:hypothetical protein [Gemmatimonadota bacterium]
MRYSQRGLGSARRQVRGGTAAVLGALLLLGCADRAPERTSPVGRRHLAWMDSTRTDWDGRGPRPLDVTVWYPAAQGSVELPWAAGVFRFGWSAQNAAWADTRRHPLVLLSHGTGGSVAQHSWLAEALVQAGFVVAGVNHHGNTAVEGLYRLPGFVLPWERALDLSALLTQLAADSALAPHLDTARVGAAGFSLGGYTVVALAGGWFSYEARARTCAERPEAPYCTLPPEAPFTLADVDSVSRVDPVFQASVARSRRPVTDARIRAILAMAPAGMPLMDSASLAGITVPVRVLLGTRDRQVDAPGTEAVLARLLPRARVSVLDAAHYDFLGQCSPKGQVVLRALCAGGGAPRAELHRQAAEAAVTFFSQTLGADTP